MGHEEEKHSTDVTVPRGEFYEFDVLDDEGNVIEIKYFPNKKKLTEHVQWHLDNLTSTFVVVTSCFE